MTVLTDTANGVTLARKDRDNAIEALTQEYREARVALCAVVTDANGVLADFDKAYVNSKRAVRQTFNNKVADLTGAPPEVVNPEDEYEASHFRYIISGR